MECLLFHRQTESGTTMSKHFHSGERLNLSLSICSGPDHFHWINKPLPPFSQRGKIYLNNNNLVQFLCFVYFYCYYLHRHYIFFLNEINNETIVGLNMNFSLFVYISIGQLPLLYQRCTEMEENNTMM